MTLPEIRKQISLCITEMYPFIIKGANNFDSIDLILLQDIAKRLNALRYDFFDIMYPEKAPKDPKKAQKDQEDSYLTRPYQYSIDDNDVIFIDFDLSGASNYLAKIDECKGKELFKNFLCCLDLLADIFLSNGIADLASFFTNTSSVFLVYSTKIYTMDESVKGNGISETDLIKKLNDPVFQAWLEGYKLVNQDYTQIENHTCTSLVEQTKKEVERLCELYPEDTGFLNSILYEIENVECLVNSREKNPEELRSSFSRIANTFSALNTINEETQKKVQDYGVLKVIWYGICSLFTNAYNSTINAWWNTDKFNKRFDTIKRIWSFYKPNIVDNEVQQTPA